MSMPGSVTLDCPAKLNLALSVAPPEAPPEALPEAPPEFPDSPDSQKPKCLHPIASWMVALSLFDELHVERIDDTAERAAESTFRLAYAADAPRPRVIDWPLADDLMVRAHGLVERRVGRRLAVRTELKKRIPTGAGLGGGSSDAAGMIVTLDRLFDLQLQPADHDALAAALGSDVHFALAALAGQTSAIVSGSGDRVEPAAKSSAWPMDVVLVLPEFGCPTGPVYAAFDRLAAATGPIDTGALHLLAETFSPTSGGILFNDLTEAACVVEPRLRELLKRLRAVTPRPVHVTGSGAACFVVAESEDEAKSLAATIRETCAVATVAAQTL